MNMVLAEYSGADKKKKRKKQTNLKRSLIFFFFIISCKKKSVTSFRAPGEQSIQRKIFLISLGKYMLWVLLGKEILTGTHNIYISREMLQIIPNHHHILQFVYFSMDKN